MRWHGSPPHPKTLDAVEKVLGGVSGLGWQTGIQRLKWLLFTGREFCRSFSTPSLVSGTLKLPVSRGEESATCRATCSRVFGTPKSRALRQVHSDVCTVFRELPRSDSTFVPTDSDPCSIVRGLSFYKLVSAPEIRQDAMSKRDLTMAAALLLSYFVAGTQTASAGGLDDKLPALDGLVRYGCAVKGPILQVDHADPSGRTRRVWSVTFWAEHMSLFGKTGVLGVCLLSGIVGFLLGRSFPHESLRIRPGKEDDPRWIRTR